MASVKKELIEFIDKKKIACALVLEKKANRIRVLTQSNREMRVGASRVLFTSDVTVPATTDRDALVKLLDTTASTRQMLAEQVNVQELWEVLVAEQDWIPLDTVTALTFPDNPTPDHTSAVIRAFFYDRLFFKFDSTRFFPHSESKLNQLEAQHAAEGKRQQLIETGCSWLTRAVRLTKDVSSNEAASLRRRETYGRVIDCLQSYYIFGKESDEHKIATAILTAAKITGTTPIYKACVNAGLWDKDENTDLILHRIPTAFSGDVLSDAADIVPVSKSAASAHAQREDLTALSVITIDNETTQDFDDALSIRRLTDVSDTVEAAGGKEGIYELGIHISDVSAYVKRDSCVDTEALARVSSIYMPDATIPMLPGILSEDICSLKQGEIRPAVSVLVTLNRNFNMVSYRIVASMIRVSKRMMYNEADQHANSATDIHTLLQIANRFRSRRFENKAIQITLPEIMIHVDDQRDIDVTRIDRQSPARVIVAEMMIMANALMARFLAEKELPAVFRSQAQPSKRLYNGDDGTMFANWMQRRHLCRLMLDTTAAPHAGLGVDAYVTATSPIRKYFDMVTQRQICSALGYGEPYSEEEMQHIIHATAQPMQTVGKIQQSRNRYWLLKYLEKKIGTTTQAMVLEKRQDTLFLLLTDYMLPVSMSASMMPGIKPEATLVVIFQQVNARKSTISVYCS